MDEHTERGRGRPPLGTRRRQRINIMIDADVLDELERRIPINQRSQHIEQLIRHDFGLPIVTNGAKVPDYCDQDIPLVIDGADW